MAQVASRTLGADMNLIKIKPMNTFIGADSFLTGEPFTTDLICQVLIKILIPIIETTLKFEQL